jgi:hypothetical protein
LCTGPDRNCIHESQCPVEMKHDFEQQRPRQPQQPQAKPVHTTPKSVHIEEEIDEGSGGELSLNLNTTITHLIYRRSRQRTNCRSATMWNK